MKTFSSDQFVAYFFRNKKLQVYVNDRLEFWRISTLEKLADNVQFSVEGRMFKKSKGSIVEIV
jgi:hypothetical protein